MVRSLDLHRDEILPGTLYLLILKTLARSGEMHGYEIANSILRISEDVLQVEEGSLYPALQRMLIKGWVTAKWGTTAGNRRARYYQLTIAVGHRHPYRRPERQVRHLRGQVEPVPDGRVRGASGAPDSLHRGV